MIDIKNIKRVYFIGIGGIGMSALARYFISKNIFVSGYDKTETPLTAELLKEGAQINYDDKMELLDKNADLIIYTPAIPLSHAQLNYYKQNNYQLAKRSDVLQAITNHTYNICVAGTHGKTTISAMIAYILRHTGYGCNAFLGGIAANYNTNFWSQIPSHSGSSDNNVCVVEADEYDRSFLKLQPDVAIISAMDADHLDIYGTEENMQDAFVEFSSKIKTGGLLLSKFGLQKDKALNADKHLRYSLQNNAADVYAANITMHQGTYQFDVMMPDWMLDNIELNMGGMHNVENAVVAIAVAQYLKIKPQKIREAIKAFKGVRRRFEYIIKNERVVFVDDYAHHPEELKALITGAKALFSNRRCVIIFQPHLFSRTKDFAKEFAEVLDLANETILLPIYPARELPIEGVTSELILNEMKSENKSIKTSEELLGYLSNSKLSPLGGDLEGALLITAGAGDIDKLVEPVKQIILKDQQN